MYVSTTTLFRCLKITIKHTKIYPPENTHHRKSASLSLLSYLQSYTAHLSLSLSLSLCLIVFVLWRIMGPIVLTQLATGLSVLAGAVLVKSVMDQKPMAGPLCPSCNGTGRVACLCSRWSDGDAGCRACSGSGRMACSSCGGTGTGRPIPVQISMRSPNRPPSWPARVFISGLLFVASIN